MRRITESNGQETVIVDDSQELEQVMDQEGEDVDIVANVDDALDYMKRVTND